MNKEFCFMKHLKGIFVFLVCNLFLVNALFAQVRSPSATQGYNVGKGGSKGNTDYHFYMGTGTSNLYNDYVPLSGFTGTNLTSSFDTYLGVGFYTTPSLAFGIESGISVSWLSAGRFRHQASDLAGMGDFWDWATPEFLDQYGFAPDTATDTRIFNTEIPIRFYAKLAPLGRSIRFLAIQGFVGFDIVFTEVTTSFYTEEAGRARVDQVDMGYIAPNFTAGLRLSLAFLGIEYSYHMGLSDAYKDFNFYKNQAHRFSIGFTFNGAI
jgi:hypothetical protein